MQVTVIWLKFVRKRNRLDNAIYRNTFFGDITQIGKLGFILKELGTI
jgi:hypothetical protein